MRTLADRIKALRLSGETQAQFAERLNTTQASISRYLNGRQPDRETLIKIASQTSVSLDWLLTGVGPGPSPSSDQKPPENNGDGVLLQAAIAYLGDLQAMAAKEKSQLQSLLKDAVEQQDLRKELVARYEELVNGAK